MKIEKEMRAPFCQVSAETQFLPLPRFQVSSHKNKKTHLRGFETFREKISDFSSIFFLWRVGSLQIAQHQLHIWYLPCLLIFKKLGYVWKYHKIFSLLCCFRFWELIYDLYFVFILLHNFVAWCGRWFFRNFRQNELELNYLNTLVIVSSEQNEIYRCQPHPGVRLHGIGVRRQPRSGPPG